MNEHTQVGSLLALHRRTRPVSNRKKPTGSVGLLLGFAQFRSTARLCQSPYQQDFE